MRHGKKVNHLGRKHGHRKALLKNLSNALIKHKRISTTLAKAKALRVHLEPIITKSKKDTIHSRRVVFSYLQDKHSVQELFSTIAGKIGDRPGGYLRIIKTGFRKGDSAEMAMIEFVDFNDTYAASIAESKASGTKTKKKRTRRGRKKASTGAETAAAATTAAVAAEVVEEAQDKVEDAVEKTDEIIDEANDVIAEADEAIEDATEDNTEENE